MKRNNKLLISVLSFSLLASLIIIDFKQETNMDVSTTHENAIGRLNIGKHNVLIGSDEQVSHSKTYVQYGTDSEGNEMLRFATAIKGDINKLSYTLDYEGLNEPLAKEVKQVYRGIQSGDTIAYYNGETITNTPSEYYWSCVTVKYKTLNKEDLDLTVQLTINDSIKVNAKVASLNDVKNGNDTEVLIPITPSIENFNYFDEDNVTLSFGAISDTHLATASNTPTILLDNVISYLEELNGGEDLTGLVIGGDLVDTTYQTTGRELADFNVFANFIKGRIDPNKTSLFYTMGNHDIDPTQNRGSDCDNVPQYYYEDLGSDYFKNDVYYQDYLNGTKVTGNRHAIINGYHFISVSPKYFWLKDAAFTNETINWLTTTLDEIVSEDPNQPIFVVSHSAIANTVRISDNINNTYGDLEEVLSPYHQVVYMAGHIHNLITDDLSIEQRDFTMMDLGSTKYSGAFNKYYSPAYSWTQDNGGKLYDNDIGSIDIGSGSYVQVDVHGNIKITRFLVNADKSIKGIVGEPWIIPAPRSDKTHLLKYNDDYRILHNKAPEFSKDARIIPTISSNSLNIAINGASDDKYVEYFQVSLKTIYGQVVRNKYFQTHYYRYLVGVEEPEIYSFDFGEVSSGTYILEVKAGDVWHSLSEPLSVVVQI